MARSLIGWKHDADKWTLETAHQEFGEWQRLPMWQQSRGRPFAMMELMVTALLSVWEAVENIKRGTKNARRQKELRTVVGALSGKWSALQGLPALTRSVEYGISLVIAAWTIKLLEEALDVWKDQRGSDR
jgi:hypothetical protein